MKKIEKYYEYIIVAVILLIIFTRSLIEFI